VRAGKRIEAVKVERRMLETFPNRKLADLGCRFDGSGKGKKEPRKISTLLRSLAGVVSLTKRKRNWF